MKHVNQSVMMRMAMAVMIVTAAGDRHFIDLTIRRFTMTVFHLDRRMTDAEFLEQMMLNAPEERVVVMRGYHLNMQSHQSLFTYLPDVNMVHVPHFGNTARQILTQLINIDLLRRALQ